MIDFRYHLVSIIAIFFALATGIVLGAGPLGEQVDQTLVDQMADIRKSNEQLQEEVATLETDRAYQDVFISEMVPEMVDARLCGRDVVVVALPGADEDLVAAIDETLVESGARVPATVTVDPRWTDPESEAALDALASELVSSGTTLPEEGTGYDRGAAVLAGALVEGGAEDGETPTEDLALPVPVGPPPVDDATLAGFTDAGLISVEGEAGTQSSLAVLVAGAPPDDDADARVATLRALATSFDSTGSGTVVAGAPAAAAEHGLLASIRDDDDVADDISTVDSADLASGRVAVVYAVVEQEDGGVGHYGVVGATDAAVPPVPEQLPEDQCGTGEGGGS